MPEPGQPVQACRPEESMIQDSGTRPSLGGGKQEPREKRSQEPQNLGLPTPWTSVHAGFGKVNWSLPGTGKVHLVSRCLSVAGQLMAKAADGLRMTGRKQALGNRFNSSGTETQPPPPPPHTSWETNLTSLPRQSCFPPPRVGPFRLFAFCLLLDTLVAARSLARHMVRGRQGLGRSTDRDAVRHDVQL